MGTLSLYQATRLAPPSLSTGDTEPFRSGLAPSRFQPASAIERFNVNDLLSAQQQSSPTQGPADAITTLARFPGQSLSTLPAIADVATGGALGRAVAPTPFGAVLEGANQALMAEGSIMPAFINSSDAKIWGAVGDMADNTVISRELLQSRGVVSPSGFFGGAQTGGIPVVGALLDFIGLGTGPGGRDKTVGELKAELTKRGFFYDDKGTFTDPAALALQIRTGKRGSFDFGHALINDDPLVATVGQFAIDPLNLLFMVPGLNIARGAALAGRIASIGGRVKVLAGLQKAGVAVKVAESAASGAQALEAGKLATTLGGMAHWMRNYGKISLGATIGNEAVDRVASMVNTVYDNTGVGFDLRGVEDFTKAVTERRDEMSMNAAVLVLGAVTFPYGATLGRAYRAVRRGRQRVLGPADFDAFAREAGSTEQMRVDLGGDVSARAMADFADVHIAVRSEGVPPALRNKILSTADLAERVRMAKQEIGVVIDRMRERGEINSEMRLRVMKEWFEGQGGFIRPDGKVTGVNPYNWKAMAKRWSDFYNGPRAKLGRWLDTTGELTYGLRKDLLKEHVDMIHDVLADSLIDEVRDGKTVRVVPLEVIRQVLNDNPHLNSGDLRGYWAQFGVGFEGPAPTWGSIRAKLAAQKRKASTIDEYYRELADLERQAPKDVEAELVRHRGMRDLRKEADDLRAAMEQEAVDSAPPSADEVRAAALAEQLRNRAAFFEERYRETGVEGMRTQARSARAQAEDAARMAGKAHTGEAPRPADRFAWESQDSSVPPGASTSPFYHAATPSEFAAIQKDGLAGNSRFGESPQKVAADFAPGESDVLLRAPRGAVRKNIDGTVPPSALEYLGVDGAWHPAAEGVASSLWTGPKIGGKTSAQTAAIIAKLERLANDPAATDGEVQAALLAIDRLDKTEASGLRGRLREVMDELRKEQIKHEEAIAAGEPGFSPEFRQKVYAQAAEVADVPLPFIDAGIKNVDAVEQVLVGLMERELAHSDPSYAVKGLPKLEIAKEIPPGLMQPVRYRHALGEALFIQGPLSPIGKTVNALLRPIRNDELRKDMRSDLQRQMLRIGFKVADVDTFIGLLEKETAQHVYPKSGPLDIRWFRDVGALLPSAVDGIMDDLVKSFPKSQRAKVRARVAAAGGGYKMLSAAHSRFSRTLVAKVARGDTARDAARTAEALADKAEKNAVKARAAISKVKTKRAQRNRTAVAEEAERLAVAARARATAKGIEAAKIRDRGAENLLATYNGWMTGKMTSGLSTAQKVFARTMYPFFRFTLDPRWLMLNYVEGGILSSTRFGVFSRYRTESEASAAGQTLLGRAVARSETMYDPGGASIGTAGLNLNALKSFDHRAANALADDIARLEKAGRVAEAAKKRVELGQELNAQMRKALDEHANTDASIKALRQGMKDDAVDIRQAAERGKADGSLTDAEYRSAIDRAAAWEKDSNLSVADYLMDQMYRVDQVGADAVLTETAKRFLSGEEYTNLAPLVQRWHDINVQAWKDVRELFYGNPNRSTLERMLNSYWFFWPLSYQIKATKWLGQIMLDGSFGRDNNALLGARYALWQQRHDDLLMNNPDYAAAFEANPVLWFTAQMILPMSPDGMGVSLSRATRLIGALGERQLNEVFGWQSNVFTLDALIEHPNEIPAYLANLGPVYSIDLYARLLSDLETGAREPRAFTPLRSPSASSTVSGIRLLPPS